jgi:uncharacterized protein HemX
MNFLEKLQSLPEKTRKIILWLIVIVIGLGLLVWWIKNFQERLKTFKMEEVKKELNLPPFEEKLKELPKIEVPEIEIPKTNEKEY